MELYEINPFVRFASKHNYNTPYSDFVIAYDYRLFFVCDGSIEIIFENTSVTLHENDMTIIPPVTKYTIKNADSHEYIVVNFDMDFSMSHLTVPMRPCSADDFDKKNILSVNLYNETPLFLSGNESARKKLSEICVEYTEKSFYHKEKSSVLLKSVIVESIIHTQADKTPKKVSEIKKYIEENYSKDIHNKDLSDKFGYHPNHINRLFKIHTQMNLHEFIIDVRLTKSIVMIHNTDMSISQIGESCGFSSDSYFIKKFKEKYGISPLKFRNQKFNKI